MSGKDVTFVAQVQESPVVVVSSEIDVSSSSAVTAVGASVGLIFCSVHVHGASAAFSGAAIDFHVVNEIALSHGGEVVCGVCSSVFG